MTTPCTPCECDELRAKVDLLAAMLRGVRDIADQTLNRADASPAALADPEPAPAR